ncbi:hypothetical protein QAD02_012884 [Eretmocerus hayati]|uniref:Uncharacterized protein n=1 Tax=Eretmocerus hayati TaxID=131215 RepID=A0ACC2P3T2_9HYME|nr:hypothetical protein QAD02_012884 [Eretmocerus hayati]
MGRPKKFTGLSKSQLNRNARKWIANTRNNPTPANPLQPNLEDRQTNWVDEGMPNVENVLPLEQEPRPRKNYVEAQTIGYAAQDCEMHDIPDFPNIRNQDEVTDSQSNMDSNTSERMSFRDRIAKWADHTVSEFKVNELLSILKDEGMDVPLTAKTLRRTRGVKTPIKKCPPGEYFHYGLQKALEEQIQKYDLPKGTKIKFDINIDGLKINDRSQRTLWPILGKITGIGRETKPFVIGIYHGFTKPRSAKTFLKDFIKEYKKLESHGFSFGGSHYTCSLRCAICDAPARSFVKCIAQHNGFYGCEKCCAKGKSVNGRMTYTRLNARKRTNFDFRRTRQKSHHLPLKRSVFEWLRALNMIKAFVLDPMHMVYLGDVKYLLNLLAEFCNSPDIDVNVDFDSFNRALEDIEKWIPAEFSKKRVRDLKKLGKWKATHARFFLLYAAVALAHRFLPPKYAEHLYKLTCAIRILSDPDQYIINNDFANELLRSFVRDFKTLYGEQYLVYNIHNLIHLAQEALRNGPLDDFSAFPFENFMRILKSYLRKPESPLQQIHLCLTQQANFIEKEQIKIFPIESGRVMCDLPLGCYDGFTKIKFQGYELSTSPPNNVCVLNNGTVVAIDYFAYKKDKRVIIGKRFEGQEDIPYYPVPSTSHFSISIVSRLSSVVEFWPMSSIYRKAVTLVHGKTCYVIPFLHGGNMSSL